MADSLPTIDPRHTALLVMDYQPGILASFENAEALLGRAVAAISLIRDAGGQVGYVRVAFEDEDYDRVPAASGMAATLARVGTTFHADTPATAVHARLAPQAGDIVVRKTRIGAFSTTDLGEQLRGGRSPP